VTVYKKVKELIEHYYIIFYTKTNIN